LLGEFLVFDTLLDVLVVIVELVDCVVGVEPLVVVFDDAFEGFLFAVRVLLVVFLFLGQVLLNLLNVGVAFGRRRKDGGDL